jgi:hypothetical protein
VVLHPFVWLPAETALHVDRYPSGEQIRAYGQKYSWAKVAAETGLHTWPKLNHALLTSIGALKAEFRDDLAMDALQRFLEYRCIWMPGKGGFEPLLQREFLLIFTEAGLNELIFVPEFAEIDPSPQHMALIPDLVRIERLSVPDLDNGNVRFPFRGSLVAPDGSFLLTVDWDSFFTVFLGGRVFVKDTVQRLNLEGFFANDSTCHSWWREEARK